jgi:hypothetical protein
MSLKEQQQGRQRATIQLMSSNILFEEEQTFFLKKSNSSIRSYTSSRAAATQFLNFLLFLFKSHRKDHGALANS